MDKIKIVAVDDHHLVRAGIRKITEGYRDLQLVGEGWAGEHIEPLLIEFQPDVLLLDISMPKFVEPSTFQEDNSFRVLPKIEKLRTKYPQTKIIIVSQYSSPILVDSVIGMGVNGYLLKNDVFSRHLADAIFAVIMGETYFSESIQNLLLKDAPLGKPLLTLRQREVLQLVVSNPHLTYPQYAEELGISIHTFNHHLRRIFNKLSVKNLTAAIVEAVRQEIITVGKRDVG